MYYSVSYFLYCVALLFLIIFLCFLFFRKGLKELDYRALFVLGVISLATGIVFNNNAILLALSPIFIVIGLVNKKRWVRTGGTIFMGVHSYGSPVIDAWVRKNAVVTIGKYCSIGIDVRFVIDGNHKMQAFSTFPFSSALGWEEAVSTNWGKGDPTVGNDVWIGNDVIIYSGVHIGDGAVIAGQSVVTKSVPPYALVAGNPAVVKKYRFDNDIIDKLLKYKWWDLSEDIIRSKIIPYTFDIVKVCDILEKIRNK